MDAAADRILLVEDDEKLGDQVAACLREAGFAPTWVRDGKQAIDVVSPAFRLLVLDLMLPGMHGLEVLRHLRRESDVPILVLSARNETPDKVRALELGADDYMTKPFWPEELLARIRARLRRPVLARRGGASVFGELLVDLAARRVEVAGVPLELTRVEFDLLAALVRRPGAAVSRAWLLEHVLDPDREGTERTLDVHVSRIRKKLGASGRRVATVWGVGYRLDPDPSS
jgi:DNA-binding response OmpR family regulator